MSTGVFGGSKWKWECKGGTGENGKGGRPVITGIQFNVGDQGFVPDEWKEVK